MELHLSEAFKICPICDTANHRNAAVCANCGTSLASVEVIPGNLRGTPQTFQYDFHYGETDLYEGSLQGKARRYLVAMIGLLLLVMLVGLGLIFAPQLSSLTVSVQTEVGSLLIVTNTERPPLPSNLATVTEGSPTLTASRTPSPTTTITATPTREPCQSVVQPSEGLIAVVSRCGHRDLFVMTEVMELNNLDDPNDIRVDQVIIVPWPTETPDPNAVPTATPDVATPEGEAGNTASDEVVDFNATLLADPFIRTTPTLPPGVIYHIVESEENAIIISDLYETSVEVLSQLNPEITFSQCDFGARFGGPRCTVPLAVGQQVRVPGPTPTISATPSPSGSETATPTPTPTFNAPSGISPSNRAFFLRDQVVTLRWVSSGVLQADQTYRVTITRTDDDAAFTADTTDLFLVVRPEWQGRGSERYEYLWSVSVVFLDNPDQLLYTTQPLGFTWQGRGEETPTNEP